MRLLCLLFAISCLAQDLPPAPDLHLCPDDTKPEVTSKPRDVAPREKNGAISLDSNAVENHNALIDIGLTVDIHGSATKVHVIRASCIAMGSPDNQQDDPCREAAERLSIAYVRQWRFKPATHCGKPIPVDAVASVAFGSPDPRLHHRP